MKSQAVVAVARDLLCLAAGVFGIVHQELTGQIRPELLIVYTTLLGIPGAVGLIQLSRGKPEATPTTTSSSPSPSASSSLD